MNLRSARVKREHGDATQPARKARFAGILCGPAKPGPALLCGPAKPGPALLCGPAKPGPAARPSTNVYR